MHGVFLDFASLAPEDLDLSAVWQLPVQWQRYDHTTAVETAERIRGQQVVLTNKVVLTAQHFAQNPQLRLVIILATGTNNVDLAAAEAHGVAVCNIVDYSTPSVVQHTIAVMLALFTRLLDYHQAVQAGQWQRSPFFGLLDYQVQEAAGKTLGIIGYGRIGRSVAAVAQALGMKLLVAQSLGGVSPQHEALTRVPLSQLLAQSDVVSIHCPLTEQSRHLIDAQALAQMKPEAYLINVGRGGIIDEPALADALRSGGIAGAAIDVLAQEPPDASNPLLAGDLPNLIVTPHSAWCSQQARQRLVEQTHGILQDLLSDKPLRNRVA